MPKEGSYLRGSYQIVKAKKISAEDADILIERLRMHIVYGELDSAIDILTKARDSLRLDEEAAKEKTLDTPLGLITGFELRLLNILENSGITTVNQLLNSDPEALLKIQNFGVAHLNTCQVLCRKFLSEKGLLHGQHNLC